MLGKQQGPVRQRDRVGGVLAIVAELHPVEQVAGVGHQQQVEHRLPVGGGQLQRDHAQQVDTQRVARGPEGQVAQASQQRDGLGGLAHGRLDQAQLSDLSSTMISCSPRSC